MSPQELAARLRGLVEAGQVGLAADLVGSERPVALASAALARLAAGALAQARRLPAARALLEEALRAHRDPWIALDLGRLLDGASAPEAAQAVLEEALAPPTIDPSVARALVGALVASLARGGRHRELVHLLGRALAAQWTDRATTALFEEAFDRLRSAGRPQDALDGFLLLLGLQGDESPVALKVADALLGLGQVEKGLTFILRLLQASPGNLLARLMKRRADAMLRALHLSEIDLQLAGRTPASITEVPFEFEGQSYVGEPTSRLRAAARRASPDADGPVAVPEGLLHIERAHLLVEEGRIDEALASLQRLSTFGPLEARVRALRARAWRLKGFCDLALEELSGVDPALLASPGMGWALHELARVQEASGKPVGALATYQRAVASGFTAAATDVARLSVLVRTIVDDAPPLAARLPGASPPSVPAGDEDAPGTIIDGDYEVVERRGIGGMAVIYKVKNRRLDRTEALKLLPAHLTGNTDAADSLVREARALAALDHPNIVKVYALGRHDRRWYLTMEFLEGMTLRALIKQRGRLPLAETLTVARGLAHGLHFAHLNGIVHRDVKPENVMLWTGPGRPGPAVKLMDFGLARDLSSSAAERRESFMGTVHYLAPERINGAPADPRSDIYALGVVLFEMLTGQVPFDSPNPHSLMFMHLSRPAPSVRTLVAELPPRAEALVLGCLEKSPDRRPASVAEVLSEITGLERADG